MENNPKQIILDQKEILEVLRGIPTVISAEYDEKSGNFLVKINDGRIAKVKFIFPKKSYQGTA